MNRTLSAVLGVVCLVALAYAGTLFWIGRMVEQEVGVWSQTLTDRDDVLVTRLDYDRGFPSGTLHYDLTLRPLEPGAWWYELLHELGMGSEQGLRLSGRLTVEHAPWVEGGPALARFGVSVPLPAEMRPYLPQYPGQEPLVTIEAVMTFGGEAQATVRVIDYRGRVHGPDMGAPGDLVVAGLGGMIRVSDTLDQLALELSMERLALRVPDEDVTMELSGLGFTADVNAFLPHVWLGPVAFRIRDVAVEAEGSRLGLSNLSIEADSSVESGMLSFSNRIAVGESRFDGYRIDSAGVEMVLANIDAVAYDDIIRMIDVSYADMDTDAGRERVVSAVGRILAGSPRFAIPRAHVAYIKPDDFTASLGLSFENPPPFDSGTLESIEAMEALIRSAVVDLQARVSIDALGSGIRLYVAEDSGDALSAEQIDATRDMMLAALLNQLRGVPAVILSDEEIRASLSLREGMLAVGGEELMDVAALAVMGAAGRFGAAPPALESGDDAADLAVDAEPLHGVLELEYDFAPDPYPVEVIAGGPASLADLLGGECVGHVVAGHPGLVLDYTAGPYPLFIYVHSDADTTLAIRDPDGRWHCNDDGEGLGLNPGIRFSTPGSGEYVIWIGTYSPDTAAATLFVSEVDFSR